MNQETKLSQARAQLAILGSDANTAAEIVQYARINPDIKSLIKGKSDRAVVALARKLAGEKRK